MIVDEKISHLTNKNVVKCLHLNVRYSAILYKYPTKSGIQEEQLLLHLDTEFS